MLKHLHGINWRPTVPHIAIIALVVGMAALVQHPRHFQQQESATQSDQEPSNENPWWSPGGLEALFTALIAVFAFWQVRESRRSSERQLRAYVMIQGMEFARPDGPNGDNQFWATHIIFKNSGQTPAFEVAVTTQIEIGVPEKPQDVVLHLTNAKRVHPESVLAPGSQQTSRLSEGLYGGLAEFHEHRNAQLTAYVWGRLDYVDIFGKPHWTTFQGVNYFGQVPQFAYCKAGNRTDDEFRRPHLPGVPEN